ncbi:rab-like protein 3 [Drosophila ficusphila]|uniref:rab-like protein 3 n=1 Tax=Drosophila ficusphila TaxID=30025 RepID=UPI0007E75517|nr:rab-like protein 3 [Drosophila ficusphila]
MKQELNIEDVPTIRILMLGDKGVGKTSLTNLLARSEDTPTPASRTVSAKSFTVQVRLHEYPTSHAPNGQTSFRSKHPGKYSHSQSAPVTEEELYFVEFYDIHSGVRMRSDYRDSLYKSIDGIVLVYNLQDMRTHDNLHDSLYDPLSQICHHRHRRTRDILKREHVPILVVGTRLDQLTRRTLRRNGNIANQVKAEEILLNCQDPDSFADNGRNQGKLRTFLNRAVEFRKRFPLSRSEKNSKDRY